MPVRALSEELAEKARVELNENPKKLHDSIEHLKDWISKQPHLRTRTDDQWLAAFLRGCKFSLERTKDKIDLHYAMRNIAPEINNISHKDPKFIEILKLGVIVIPPKVVNTTDPRYILLRGGQYDPSKYTAIEVMSVLHVLQKIMFVDDDIFTICGVVNIIDLAGTTISHFTNLSPVLIKKMVVVAQEATPLRMKASHYLNTSSAFEVILNITKSFLNEKNRNRLYVHNKCIESLHKHVPNEILPVEYKGNGGTVQETIDYWVKKVEEYSSWLEEDEKYGTDESKRPGKPKTAEDMFGVDGSFRQLEFD